MTDGERVFYVIGSVLWFCLVSVVLLVVLVLAAHLLWELTARVWGLV